MVRTVDGEYLSNTYCIPKAVSTGTDVAHGSVEDRVRQRAYKDFAQSRCSVGVTFSLFQFVSRHENFSGFLLPQPPASEQDMAASTGVTLREA